MHRLLIKPQIPFTSKLKKYLSSRAKCVTSQHIQHSSTTLYHDHASRSPSFSHVNASHAPQPQKDTPFQFQFHPNSALVYPDFISTTEASTLEEDAMKRMQRTRFQKGHWDAVIQNYKEVELLASAHVPEQSSSFKNQMSQVSLLAMERVRDHISQTHFFPNANANANMVSTPYTSLDNENERHTLEWLNCHAIYLKKEGLLTAHVDSIKFSGDVVAGVSLLSSSIMRLRPASSSELARRDGTDGDDDDDLCLEGKEDTDGGGDISSKAIMDAGYVDLYLPPRSLYVLSGVSRYMYTHEILPCNSQFQFGTDDGDGSARRNGDHVNVQREDRISIIFRDAI